MLSSWFDKRTVVKIVPPKLLVLDECILGSATNHSTIWSRNEIVSYIGSTETESVRLRQMWRWILRIFGSLDVGASTLHWNDGVCV